MQKHLIDLLVVLTSLVWALVSTFLGASIPSSVASWLGSVGPAFLIPLMWLAYGLVAGLKRGAVVAGIVLVCSAALWGLWRLRPEAAYMNVAEDLIYFTMLTVQMVAFLIGVAIRYLASLSRKKRTQ